MKNYTWRDVAGAFVAGIVLTDVVFALALVLGVI